MESTTPGTMSSGQRPMVFVLRCIMVATLGALFLQQAHTSVLKYLNYDTVTSMRTVIQNSQPFPSVSLCPLETR